jgi:hypothetical protein
MTVQRQTPATPSILPAGGENHRPTPSPHAMPSPGRTAWIRSKSSPLPPGRHRRPPAEAEGTRWLDALLSGSLRDNRRLREPRWKARTPQSRNRDKSSHQQQQNPIRKCVARLRAEQRLSLTIARHEYPGWHRMGNTLRHIYRAEIFRRADHWVGAKMTDKTSQDLHKSQLRTETSSIADQIAAALCSVETEACMKGSGLPLAPLLPPTPASSLYCALTPIDDRGRLAARSPIRALGWPPAQPITISVLQETVVVISQPTGTESITRQGHLRLPAHVRHLCHLTPGDRLLIAAAPGPGILVGYTMPLLESILLTHHLPAPPHEATNE